MECDFNHSEPTTSSPCLGNEIMIVLNAVLWLASAESRPSPLDVLPELLPDISGTWVRVEGKE